jgi:hypothetical protein
MDREIATLRLARTDGDRRAVTELFGPEYAMLAAEDWVDELELMDASPGSTRRGWGSVTVAASARPARRLNSKLERRTPSDTNA